MTSYLSGGLASLDRWEGLKEWHRRHQDLLGEQSTSFQTEGFGNNCHSSMPNVVVKESHLKPKDSFLAHEGKENIVLAPDAAKHDLSIIQEADEDSRSKDGDLDGLKLYQGWSRGGRGESPETNEESSCKTQKSNNGNSRKTDGLFMNKREEQNNNCDKRVVKRPFLRKGKGLVRYNLKPDDLRHPYKNAPPNKTLSEKNSNLIRQGRLSGKPCVPNAVLGQSIAKKNLSYKKFAKAYDLTAPVQHLALQIPPQKFSGVEVGSWSQLFGADKDSSGKIDNDTSKALVLQKGETDTSTVSQKMRAKRVVNIMSAQNKVDLSIKQASSPEEDQDSLAAYLDLEQHVGNASFCSTSSKVDRLVAKSSEPTVCQSNPDAITQLKELTPTKTGRKIFNNVQGDCSFPESYYHMWSTSDLKNLIKSRALRSGSLMKANVEKNKAGNNHESNKTSPPKESRGVERNHSFTDPTQLEAPSVGWTVESLEARRKPHLMKTMSGIDLDSSLIKNALAPVLNPDISDSLFDSESSLSESSSDGEFDQNISESTEHPEIKESKLTGEDSVKCQVFKETQIAAQVPLQPTNNACLEELNIQIEARLSDLRKEIETLQAAKAKTQKYISSLEKKVQELEHRIALDARSFNKRLEDEREAAAKKLTEEQTKFLREKQSLQRTIRDERKKAPDPITQQELMRLKQEIAQWEEKWRADRAKARGLESNLRIQITNLKRENDKLKEETCKLQREKDTALSTAKARAASNTRVINSIAQQLGNTKPKVSVVREEIKEARKQTNRSAYNLKQSGQSKDSKNLNPVATIENFPEFPNRSNEWSTDEEIDLGKESSDDDVNELIKSSALYAEMLPTEPKLLQTKQHASTMETDQTNSITSLEETLAKYDAIFGNDKFDLIKEDMPGQRFTNSQVNQAWCKEKQPEMENFVKSVQHLDGKVEQIKENGTRVITYPDGTWKRHSSSGSVMTVPPSGWPVHISYFNGDQLEKLQDGTTRYFYAKTNVWQTTHPDGNEEMLYPSGQVERRDKDGTVKVLLPSVSSEPLHSSNNQPDGISIEKLHNGDTLILLPSGERELHTKEFMKKEFLDGSVKFLYNDGSQETHYPSGRIRVKDAQGNLIKDTSQSD